MKQKLTEQDIQTIVSRLRAGEKKSALAEEYGISVFSIYYHLKCLGISIKEKGQKVEETPLQPGYGWCDSLSKRMLTRALL